MSIWRVRVHKIWCTPHCYTRHSFGALNWNHIYYVNVLIGKFCIHTRCAICSRFDTYQWNNNNNNKSSTSSMTITTIYILHLALAMKRRRRKREKSILKNGLHFRAVGLHHIFQILKCNSMGARTVKLSFVVWVSEYKHFLFYSFIRRSPHFQVCKCWMCMCWSQKSRSLKSRVFHFYVVE